MEKIEIESEKEKTSEKESELDTEKTNSIKEEEKEQEKENISEKEKETQKVSEKENIKETSHEDKISLMSTNIPTNIPSEEIKPTNITLSFRQVNNFQQNNTSKIEFDLFTLTMNEYLSKGLKITVFVNLIHINGIRDEEPTEAICILTKEIKANASSSSAPFHCSIENLNETYYSFRYNYSNYIIGVPNDEVALDPILTKKAIERREILDSSDESNLPPTFII